MADTLKHPAVTPTTTVTFDGVFDLARGREAMNSKDFGGYAGVSRLAASNRTKAHYTWSFYLVTDGATSARDKVKVLAELMAAYADEDMEVVFDFGGGETLTLVGKIANEDGSFVGGTATTRYMGTIAFNTATVVWS